MLQEFQLQPMVHKAAKAAKAAGGEAPPPPPYSSSAKTTSDTADSSMTSSIASTSPQLQHSSSPVGNGNAKGDMCLLYGRTVRADNFGNMT